MLSICPTSPGAPQAPGRAPVGWPALALLAGAGALALGWLDAAGLWLLSFFLLGMPHGALDVCRAWQCLAGQPRRPARYAAFWGAYLAVAAAYGLLWWASPWVAMALFLALTAWHWGTAEAQWLGLPARPHITLALARGTWVVALPVAADFTPCIAVLAEMVRAEGALPPPEGALHTAFILLALGTWALDATLLTRHRRWPALAEIGVLGAGALLLPGPAFIALFFICVHAGRYLLWVFRRREQPARPASIISRYGLATVLSVAIFALWALPLDPATARWQAEIPALAAYLVLIACLTLPHALLVERLDGFWRPSA